jgi:hypothetical protein
MVSGETLNFDAITVNAKDFITHYWNEPKKEVNDCPTCGKNGIVFAGDEVDLFTKEKSKAEIWSEQIQIPAPKNENPNGQIESIPTYEFIISTYRGLITGDDDNRLFPLRIM